MVARRRSGPAAVKPVASDTPEVNDLQRQVAEMQRQFNPFTQGEMIEWKQKVAFVTFKHGLGRVPQGIIQLGCSVTAIPQNVSIGIKSSTDSAITLGIPSMCDGKVWVF